MKYRILEFDPHMLDGKVQIDSEMPDSVKPVSISVDYLLLHFQQRWKALLASLFLSEPQGWPEAEGN